MLNDCEYEKQSSIQFLGESRNPAKSCLRPQISNVCFQMMGCIISVGYRCFTIELYPLIRELRRTWARLSIKVRVLGF
jgi:hypothetical protein